MNEFNNDYSRDLSVLDKYAELRDKVSQYETELAAISDYDAAIRLDPDDAGVYSN